jgi:hypothetical protein
VLNSVEKRNKRKEMESCGYILGEERDASLDDPLHITRVDAITLNGQSRLLLVSCGVEKATALTFTLQRALDIVREKLCKDDNPLIICVDEIIELDRLGANQLGMLKGGQWRNRYCQL